MRYWLEKNTDKSSTLPRTYFHYHNNKTILCYDGLVGILKHCTYFICETWIIIIFNKIKQINMNSIWFDFNILYVSNYMYIQDSRVID